VTEQAQRAEELDEVGPSLDEGLRGLPRPRRTMRSVTIVVIAITISLCGWLTWSLRGEALYSATEGKVLEIGVFTRAKLDDRVSNRYVRTLIELRGVKAVRFKRLLDRDEYRIAMASPDRWVDYRVPKALAVPRFVPPGLVAGRLVRVAELGPRFRGLASALSEASGQPAGQAWVLVDGHSPSAAGWLVGLEIMLLAFLAWNGLALVRITRPIRPDGRDD
jgi:hypothetical protein